MKKLLTLVTAILFITTANAQPGAKTNIGHIYGKIIDSATGKPLSDVSVMVLTNQIDKATKKTKQVLVKGLATEKNGDFSLTELPIMSALTLKISATGYKPYELPVKFNMAAGLSGIDMDLGNLSLKENANVLQTVVVTAERANMQLDIDKKVFYVDKNIVSSGGTALDVMKNVPSVQVDIDGSVKLRNAAPQLFIDGRPTTLTLEQIPADAIEKVEVITNPSAKYDASGGNAGILNIVLKKNRKSGYNGMLMAVADSRGGLTGMGNFSYRQDKVNITATAFGSQIRTTTQGTTDRLNLLSNPLVLVSQQNENKTKGGFFFGNLGLDYFLTNRTTLSLSGFKVSGKFEPSEIINIHSDSLLQAGIKSTFSNRLSNNNVSFDATGFKAGMKHLFPKAGEELTADFNFNSSKNDGNGVFTNEYMGNNFNVKNRTAQKVTYGGENQAITLQTDYVKPLNGKGKIETGLRAQLTEVLNNTQSFYSAAANGDYILIPNTTTNYKNSNNVYAAYGTFTQSIKDFGYQVGLRAESSKYKGALTNTGQQFENSYPVSLFPSLFLSQKLKNKQELQLNYSRRINRPGFMQVLPYTNFIDSLNITRGNPDLRPSFTNSFEASYSKNFKGGHNLLFSAYYKHSTDLITSFLDKQINPATGREDIINTFINANSSYTTGAEITSINKLTKWLDITTNLNLYNSKINTDAIFGTSQDARWSWFGKFNSNLKLPAKFTAQVSANYQSKTNMAVETGGKSFDGGSQAQSTAQGYINSYWSMDMAVKKTFLKDDMGALTLSVNDLFRTRTVLQHSESQYFITRLFTHHQSANIAFNFHLSLRQVRCFAFQKKE